jgi:hypothetical protein
MNPQRYRPVASWRYGAATESRHCAQECDAVPKPGSGGVRATHLVAPQPRSRRCVRAAHCNLRCCDDYGRPSAAKDVYTTTQSFSAGNVSAVAPPARGHSPSIAGDIGSISATVVALSDGPLTIDLNQRNVHFAWIRFVHLVRATAAHARDHSTNERLRRVQVGNPNRILIQERVLAAPSVRAGLTALCVRFPNLFTPKKPSMACADSSTSRRGDRTPVVHATGRRRLLGTRPHDVASTGAHSNAVR